MRSLKENLRLRLCHIDWTIVKSMLQGWGLKLSHKEWTFKVNKVFIGFLLCFCKPRISPRAVWENNEPTITQSECVLYRQQEQDVSSYFLVPIIQRQKCSYSWSKRIYYTFSWTMDTNGRTNKTSFSCSSSSLKMRISATKVLPPLVGRE